MAELRVGLTLRRIKLDRGIGGYSVLDKWLKDRRGRVLEPYDVERFAQVVTAVTATIRVMNEIDDVIGPWPLS